MTFSNGFWIRGAASEERQLVNWQAAFFGHASLEDCVDFNREGYLSAFTFDDDFRKYLDKHQSTRGFDGVCSGDYLWFDIDCADDLEAARRGAARLALFLNDRYGLGEDDVLIFFSGSKGFHLGLPTELWAPAGSRIFNRVCRRMAENLADAAKVAIDFRIYDKVRAFRAPGSRHPRTNLHKRHLTLDELIHLSVERIQGLAHEPATFDLPTGLTPCDRAAADWQEALQALEQDSEAIRFRRSAANGSATLNVATREFINDGAEEGERHSRLFSAAANLAEFGCPNELAHALLTQPARDSGLPPREIRRAIDEGLNHSNRRNNN